MSEPVRQLVVVVLVVLIAIGTVLGFLVANVARKRPKVPRVCSRWPPCGV
jgi:ABC-type multidrug transport system permease subunit